MTALTVYYTNTTSTTLSTANQLSITHGTDNTNVTMDYSLVGIATGWGEVYAQGNASAWAAAGSIGSPSGHGFMLESSVLNLAGNTIAAGSWTANVRLGCGHTNGNLIGTLTGCTIHVRIYKYNGGVYTQIVDMSLGGQSINATLTTYALSSGEGGAVATSFSSGDLLYVDVWVQVGTNSNADAALNIRLNRISTNFTGDSNAEVVTPGYAPTNTQTNTRTITATTALLATSTRPITTTAALLATSMRPITTTAALLATSARMIPSTASLYAGLLNPNAIMHVRSGKVIVYIRRG